MDVIGHIVQAHGGEPSAFHPWPLDNCPLCQKPRPVNEVLDDIVKKLQVIRDQLHDALKNIPE